jgi:hypothetical protein
MYIRLVGHDMWKKAVEAFKWNSAGFCHKHIRSPAVQVSRRKGLHQQQPGQKAVACGLNLSPHAGSRRMALHGTPCHTCGRCNNRIRACFGQQKSTYPVALTGMAMMACTELDSHA